MSYLIKIQKALDFIEAHLQEELDLVKVSKIVSFSPFHFHDVFSATVGETFKEYIRKRRLTEAAYELRGSSRKILDIALDYGFESQESFSRAFKKMFLETPGSFRKQSIAPQFYLKKKLSLKELEHRMKGIKMKSKMIKLPAINLIGVEYKGSSEHKQTIGKLWEELVIRREEISNKIDSDIEIGFCYSSPQMLKNNEIRYVAGVKVKSIENTPNGMVSIKIPARQYAVFTHKGPISRIKETYDYIYKAWFPKSNYEPLDAADLEFYDSRFKYDSADSEFDLYIPIQ